MEFDGFVFVKRERNKSDEKEISKTLSEEIVLLF
jgi:hypothetical protein